MLLESLPAMQLTLLKYGKFGEYFEFLKVHRSERKKCSKEVI